MRKMCITTIQRYDFVIIGKNTIMERRFGFHKVELWRPRMGDSRVLM